MPVHTLPPDQTSHDRETMGRVEQLEHRRPYQASEKVVEALRFSTVGTITVSESGPDTAAIGGTIVVVLARLRVAGSSTTTATVKRNGAVITTINLTSGLTVVRMYPAGSIRPDVDFVTCAVTAVGTGAAGLVVQVRLR